MGDITKKLLQNLYLSGKSLTEIGETLGYSPHKVVYWMNKHHLSRRSRSDAQYTKLNPHGDPFKIKKPSSLKEALMFGLGLGIYWGEGNKSSPHTVRVSNTDPQLIRTFREFLIQICNVKISKIQYSLVCFNDINPDAAVEYWSKQLGVSSQKFGKIVQIPKQGKGTYKKKSQFGVCSITFGNIKLKSWIMQQISAFSPDS